MRRFLAILLLLTFGSFLSEPLVAASSDQFANLPACCRRNGKHHCTMHNMMQWDLSSTTRVFNPSQKCPFYPKLRMILLVFGHFIQPPARNYIDTSLLNSTIVRTRTRALYRIAFDRSRQKRGPPVSSLS